MEARSDEIEAFKTQIDLVAFAEDQGYEIDRRRTSRTSVAMRHGTSGERILVAKAGNGHFIYASVHDHLASALMPTAQSNAIDRTWPACRTFS